MQEGREDCPGSAISAGWAGGRNAGDEAQKARPDGFAQRRVHIMGCQRSGTTLLMQMLYSCFAGVTHPPDELPLFRRIPGRPELFVSKFPRDILRVSTVLDGDPGLWAIYVVRDPRSVAASRHRTAPEVYIADVEEWLEAEDAARRLEGHPRFMRVRYEHLVREPDAVQREIVERLPFLVPTRPFSRFHEAGPASERAERNMNGLRAPDPSGIEAWRCNLPRVAAEVRLHPDLPRRLIQAGYESDRTWLDLLDGVEAEYARRPPRLRRALARFWSRLRAARKARRYLRELRRRA